MSTKYLYAVEIDVTKDANAQGRRCDANGECWVILAESNSDDRYHLCVFDTLSEAREESRGLEHKSRVVKFFREQPNKDQQP